MVKRTKELDMKAIAITDHGNMYGTIKFYKECVAQGIKPIIGCEIYISKRTRHDKEAGLDADSNHLILLAKNDKGYKNLMKIISVANLEDITTVPVVIRTLREHSEGIICLSACINGFVSQPLLEGQEDTAIEKSKTVKNIWEKKILFRDPKHVNIEKQDILK